ncbi:hypothetical protein Vretifemale_9115 [Volvox reticuliferus]|nr:hypothetical protein Vretifemale_9115 [Volvox reticuliferus]
MSSALSPPGPMPGLQPCQRPIPRLIMRTKFFDDVVTAVTWRGSAVGYEAGGRSCHTQLLAAVRRAERPCRQVTQAGSDDAARSASGATVKWRYPLHAADWSCCAVDLQRSGWSRGLLDKGLDSSSPVLWVLEGLLYYLDEPDVRALLQEAASMSAPGSIMAASVIRAVQSADSAGGTTLLPFHGRSAPSSDGKGPSGEGRATYRLNSEFKWKCCEDIPKFFSDCGWGATACLSWLDAAKSYGFPTAEATTSSVFFLTAALA